MNLNAQFTSIISPFSKECLWHIYSTISNNEQSKELSFNELKEVTLFLFKKMMDYDLISIVFAFRTEAVPKKDYSKLIEKLDLVWTEKTEFIELYTMVWFEYNDWYVSGLKKEGLTEETDWEIFVKRIGNFQKWIEEHRPK